MQTRILPLIASVVFVAASFAAEPAKFTSGIVDIGVVAKDLGKTAKFYVEVVGLKEVKGFEASAGKATAFGLTDNQPAKIRVFVLGEVPISTRLKIMAFPERPDKMLNQKFIYSSIGISYLTLRVEDMTAAWARLKMPRSNCWEKPRLHWGATIVSRFFMIRMATS